MRFEPSSWNQFMQWLQKNATPSSLRPVIMDHTSNGKFHPLPQKNWTSIILPNWHCPPLPHFSVTLYLDIGLPHCNTSCGFLIHGCTLITQWTGPQLTDSRVYIIRYFPSSRNAGLYALATLVHLVDRDICQQVVFHQDHTVCNRMYKNCIWASDFSTTVIKHFPLGCALTVFIFAQEE